METILRAHCLQLLRNLSDAVMEEYLHESPMYACSVNLNGAARPPVGSIILRVRHLVQKNNLALQVMATINARPAHKGLLLKNGTVEDATIIAAPGSTKNSSGECDSEMHPTKKGNQ